MGFFSRLFSSDEAEPSEGQIRRAIKQVTQTHGDAANRIIAMERLAAWRTPESAAALLRRFTVQTPQASMDLEEKQYAVKLLTEIGEIAINPIADWLKTEPDVAYPVLALKNICSPEKYRTTLVEVIEALSSGYSRWPEARVVLITGLEDDAFQQVGETVFRFLDDDNDDVCIAAADYLARNGGEPAREKLIQVYLAAEGRPRVRGHMLDLFYERNWGVGKHKKDVEVVISPPFYLTAKGMVKRRGQG
jgi:HEAT repeat protein